MHCFSFLFLKDKISFHDKYEWGKLVFKMPKTYKLARCKHEKLDNGKETHFHWNVDQLLLNDINNPLIGAAGEHTDPRYRREPCVSQQWNGGVQIGNPDPTDPEPHSRQSRPRTHPGFRPGSPGHQNVWGWSGSEVHLFLGQRERIPTEGVRDRAGHGEGRVPVYWVWLRVLGGPQYDHDGVRSEVVGSRRLESGHSPHV